ncbi:MAG TPA: glycosyl hydrolase, partial [Rhabdochlamydiaceae bacterium]|nr:glycosyl hydrolase [Rhabdochlamydiaceae bacterium]
AHYNPAPGVNNQTYADGIVTSNYFLLQFNMMMAQFLSSDCASFQTTQRQLPSYTITAPVDTYGIYAAHRRYIPIQADLSYTSESVTWSYTLSPLVNPGDGSNKTLVCFPFWKYLQAGQPLQNFIYNDVVKGTFYAAEAIDGNVTFLEGGLPSWYGPDLFIPSTFTFTDPQKTVLNNILNNIFPNLIDPLPLFPEVYLNTAYTAVRTVFMLANTGLATAYFLTASGQSGNIATQSKPFIDNAKSVLTSYLIGRIPGTNFFIADRTTGGICVNGGGGIGDYPEGPNLQQINDTGADFGNYTYNDHHFFAGYALLAAAMITEWELKYGAASLWVDLPVMGADGQQYKIADFVDFLWRDVHNPYQNDPDLPYDRYGLPWEGHSVANGMQYDGNTAGRNQESIAEDFNCWYGMNAFARVMLKTSLTSNEIAKYETVRDFSDMNMKMNGSCAIMWFKNTNYWKAVPGPTSLAPSFGVGQYSQVTVTTGQVNDNATQNQVFQ